MEAWLAQHFPAQWWDNVLQRFADSAFDVVRVLIVYALLRWMIVYGVQRFSAPIAVLETDPVRARRVKTLRGLVRSALLYTLAIVTGIMLLRAVGVDPVPLVTAAGVAGLAIGFGAQKLVRDVISGFFILLENQFSVGETVTIAGTTGTVSEVGLRTTRIQDAQGKLYIFSNGDISSVCNHSRADLTVPVEVGVAASVDIEKACQALDEVGQVVGQRYHLAQPFRAEGVSAFDSAKVTLKVVGRVPPGRQDEILADLRAEILKHFQAEGIAMA